jgi:hypothetical protein
VVTATIQVDDPGTQTHPKKQSTPSVVFGGPGQQPTSIASEVGIPKKVVPLIQIGAGLATAGLGALGAAGGAAEAGTGAAEAGAGASEAGAGAAEAGTGGVSAAEGAAGLLGIAGISDLISAYGTRLLEILGGGVLIIFGLVVLARAHPGGDV